MKKTLFLLIIVTVLASCDLFKGYQILSEMQAEPELPKSHTDNVIMPINDYFSPDANNTWTFMIVLNGDNNLERFAIEDFNEMELGLYKGLLRKPDLTKYLNIVVLIDRGSYDGGSLDPEWSDTKIFKIQPDTDMSRINSLEITTDYRTVTGAADEQNLGDPASFTNFIDYCTEKYTADHYAFVIWNHGDGPYSRNLNYYIPNESNIRYSISLDNNNSSSLYDECTMKELQTALTNTNLLSNQKLDLMGFDACLMGSVEVAYQFQNQVEYLVASMDEIGQDGWNFEMLFENMGLATNSTYSDSRTLSKVLVQNYYDTYKNSDYSSQYATMTAIDLSKMEAFKTKVDNLAYNLSETTNQSDMEPIRWASKAYVDYSLGMYVDFYDLCIKIESHFGMESQLGQAARNVIEEFSQCIVAAYGHEDYGHYLGLGEYVKRGLFIVYPRYQFSAYYSTSWYNESLLDFCAINGGLTDTWIELLQDWF